MKNSRFKIINQSKFSKRNDPKDVSEGYKSMHYTHDPNISIMGSTFQVTSDGNVQNPSDQKIQKCHSVVGKKDNLAQQSFFVNLPNSQSYL